MDDILKDFKVLAVDDNPKNIQVIGSILMEANYEVGFAIDGKQALDLLNESNDYDLVLLDINMPVMNGFEACKAMRNNKLLREIPVIFLTAMNEPENILAGFEAGGQDYVTKPFNARELLSRVKTHLELKRSKDQLKIVNQWLEIKVQERTKELLQTNAALGIVNNELILLEKVKADFLEKLSREVRAPLAGIMGYLSALKDEMDPSELLDLLKYLDVSVERLERFTTTSLLITQLRTNTAEISVSAINSGELLSFVTQRQADQIELRGMTVVVNGDPTAITIYGQRNLLELCFENLIDNALKYAPVGSKLIIDVESADNRTICTFKDQGRRFTTETLTQIKELLSREDTKLDENDALDIALVKLIMDAHHGKMEISNNEDLGSVIKLIFPGQN
jgi:two-component system, sensor histidine kinase and response regulator